MKIDDVIKKLREFPNLKFTRTDWVDIYITLENETGRLILCNDKYGKSYFRLGYGIDDEWELIQETVPWQEAIQAWFDGMDIKCEEGGKTYSFSGKMSRLQDEICIPIDRARMKYGKWYIL